MTKPLNTQLSQQDGPAPRSAARPRTWLVALLGFGAADLLVLNLWAVPNLITNSATTTDMRAAQSGEVQEPSAPQPEPDEVAALAQPSEPERPGAPAELVEAAKAEAAANEAEAAAPAPASEPPAAPATPAEARAKLREALRQPPPEPEHVDAPPQPGAAQPGARPQAEPRAAAERQSGAARRASAPSESPQPVPADPPAGLSADAYAPPEQGNAAPFAVRAAQRAVRFALLDRIGASGTGPFDGLTEEDRPLSQIYFSLGNFMLGPNGTQALERLLPKLASDDRPILIVGSADPSGSEQVNEKLSDARAQAVAEWLLVHGVDAGRIQTRAIGREGAVGNTLDRRVDIWLGGSR